MTDNEWNAFCEFREDFKEKVKEWSSVGAEISELAKKAAKKDTPEYNIENPVVYNTALDSFSKEDEIKLIVIGDNPGKNEQLSKNQKYLVGQAGKIGEGFFARNPELGIDFRKNAIILNKTPVHSAKTCHLKVFKKEASEEVLKVLEESQIWMAERTALLHKSLSGCALWLVGYAELKNKGIFSLYRDKLLESSGAFDRVFVFQHFSMNCFTQDLKKFMAKNPELALSEAIDELGHIHRKEIFGK